MREFMSGNGGFGVMYQDFGYRPSQRVRDEGFLELICGRIYVDADRAAEVFWEGLPFKYDHQAVLADPRILEAAPTEFDATRADEKFLMRLPGTLRAVWRCWRTMKRARRDALHEFEDMALPPYLAYVEQQRGRDLTKLSTAEVVAELGSRVRRVLTEFGKESLKPGFFGGCARAELEGRLVQLMGPAEGGKLCQTLTSGLANDSTVEQNAMLFDVARGKAKLEDFIERYGHRGVGEMELAKPRWREDASYLYQIIEGLKTSESNSPASLHRGNEQRRDKAMSELPQTLAVWGGSFLREEIERLAVEAQDLLPYRESGKHYLLMGYELIRTAILELGRRWNLGDDVFFLHLEELGRFESEAAALTKEAGRRRIRWQSAQ
jgi:pyruvate,water dikinase